jgi:hypothetical protein
MGNEEPFTKPVKRRHERQKQERPSKRETAGLPGSHAAPDGGPAPQAYDAGCIKAAGER